MRERFDESQRTSRIVCVSEKETDVRLNKNKRVNEYLKLNMNLSLIFIRKNNKRILISFDSSPYYR